MTRFKGEEIHNKMENGIKVGPNGQFTKNLDSPSKHVPAGTRTGITRL